MSRIEALLSARLFLVPQLIGDRIYFVSNLSGHMSLYAMKVGGSVPEPLLPPNIALQNPKLVQGDLFTVFPKLGKILVMIDANGDERYEPALIPLDGGFPELIFTEQLADANVSTFAGDLERNFIYMMAQSRSESKFDSYLANIETLTLTHLSSSMFGGFPIARSRNHDQFIFAEGFGPGDNVLYRRTLDDADWTLWFSKPPFVRTPDDDIKPTGIGFGTFINNESALLVSTIAFDDQGGLAVMPMDDPTAMQPVTINGLVHSGMGELEGFNRLDDNDNRYTLTYNIDGCSWVYEAEYDEAALTMTVTHILVGQGDLSNGVLEAIKYNKQGDCYVLVFSTAISPTQIYTLAGEKRDQLQRHTNERILGISAETLSTGEDYSYTSHDGLRVSARLYMPADELGYEGPRPLVYYIHGGPQSQERPDFAWFSMPLIQQLTLRGFAVFVPNVRGSTGYGFAYMHHVVRDWGGQDRLDHVHAMTEVLAKDPRIDIKRAGVTGRSYGGYMTLTLAARHPDLWAAAIDMFGPYDLTNFTERVPETWKPFMKFMVGDPETERDLLLERSPRTYMDNIACPMLVIQGKNDPRVWEIESRELVDELNEKGKSVEYLMFEDEGHDILKYDNRVRCYNAIVDFFEEHL